MLIVCPDCATSYMIEQAAIGAAGRTVRCARCKSSWFAGGPQAAPEVSTAVDNAIAQAEAPSASAIRSEAPPPVVAAPQPAQAAGEDSESIVATEIEAPPVEPPRPEPEPAPAEVLPPAETEAPAARPIMIIDAPPLVPPIEQESPEAAEAEQDSEEVESLEARRRWLLARRKQSRGSSRWTAVILALVAFNVALLGARNEVVRYLPQTASLFAAIGLPVNLRHLRFEQVRISKEVQDGITSLTVQGAIVSEAGKPVEVPRLRFALRNSTGQEVYTWTMLPPQSILEPAARLEFRSQIPAPPVDASDVMVRFFSAKDIGAR